MHYGRTLNSEELRNPEESTPASFEPESPISKPRALNPQMTDMGIQISAKARPLFLNRSSLTRDLKLHPNLCYGFKPGVTRGSAGTPQSILGCRKFVMIRFQSPSIISPCNLQATKTLITKPLVPTLAPAPKPEHTKVFAAQYNKP